MAISPEVLTELEFVEDRHFNLKNQVKGSKKKYLLETRKIEDILSRYYEL